jgi:hypothetical protein
MTRAVAVAAPRAVVWRWVCQIAVAPYSYDFIDYHPRERVAFGATLPRSGRRSPRELTPGADRIEPGQRVQVFDVTSVEPGHQWSGVTWPRVFGRTAVTYAVEEAESGSRLVCRIVTSQRGLVAWVWSRLLAWGDLVMMRKQLLTLKELAEGGR